MTHYTAKPLPGQIMVRPAIDQPPSQLVHMDPVMSNERGEVLAVGDGVEDIEPGETILHKRFAGAQVLLNGEVIVFLERSDVLAHLEEQRILTPTLIA